MQRQLNRLLMVAIVTSIWPMAARSQPPNRPPAGVQKVVAQAEAAPTKPAAVNRFELKDGDRVVFIGNTFFEREGRYGYIETMLTTRYPGKRITFRNLGWSGDTVWGESRGYFEPEKGYQNLIDLVAELKPTVIFLAYGNIEAFAGKDGLEPFIKQYNKLLDDLERFTKRIVILGCLIPEKHERPLPDLSGYSSMTELYNTAIEAGARKRELHFFPIQILKLDRLGRRSTDNGLHLHDVGYFAVADALCENMYPKAEPWVVGLRLASGEEVIGGTKVQLFETTEEGVSLLLLDNCLPLPKCRDLFQTRAISIGGLREGTYRLTVDGQLVREVNTDRLPGFAVFPLVHKEAIKRLEAKPLPEMEQAEKLRIAIIAKNQLFFYRWRPQNTTYLLGFRKHEQGQNAKEIAQFDPLIAAKEEEIFKLAQPVPHKYELVRVKEDGKGGGEQPDGDKAGETKGEQ